MVNLELSVIDALAIESLLCMLDSRVKLGSNFKAFYSRYLVALSKAGLTNVVGDIVPDEFDMSGFDLKS